MNSNVRILLASFLLTLSLTNQAQHDYRNGYVITNGNDTLFGQINLFKIEGEGGHGFFTTCGLGFLVKTFNEFYLSAGVDAEWRPILVSLVIDSKIEGISYSLNIGMHFRF